MLSRGRLKSPLSPGVDQAASGSDSPLQFVMYLRNFCLYTNFSPPVLIPSSASSPPYNGPFHPLPAAFCSNIIFNVWKLSPSPLRASISFRPKCSSSLSSFYNDNMFIYYIVIFLFLSFFLIKAHSSVIITYADIHFRF